MATSSLRSNGRFLAIMMVAGLALRLMWLTVVHGAPFVALSSAEASNVAVAFARSGALADAYFDGQGPTAHLMPINPALAGWAMRWLGEASPASAIVLTLWSVGQVFAAYGVLFAAYRRAGLPAVPLRQGAAILFLLPVFVPQEVVDFRYWEGGTTLLLVALHLRWTMIAESGTALRRVDQLLIAVAGALLVFIAPPVGIAVGCAWASVACRHLSARSIVTIASVGGVLLCALTLGWMARNEATLGVPLPSRSNAGIELALANYAGSDADLAPENRFEARLLAIHPAANLGAQAMVRRIGEAAYSQRLQRSALDWIERHPAPFARLYLRHLSEFLFPRPWQFYFTGWEGLRQSRSAIVSLVSALGVVGLLFGCLARQRGFGAVAIYAGVLALQFALFQPMPRYSFLVYAVLVWPAAYVTAQLSALIDRHGERRRVPGREAQAG